MLYEIFKINGKQKIKMLKMVNSSNSKIMEEKKSHHL